MLWKSKHLQNLVKIHLFILKILSRNKILTSFKGHNSVLNWLKLTYNNPKLDVVNINASAKFGQNLFNIHTQDIFLHSQDTERKRNSLFRGQICSKSIKVFQAIARKGKCYRRTISKQYNTPYFIWGWGWGGYNENLHKRYMLGRGLLNKHF